MPTFFSCNSSNGETQFDIMDSVRAAESTRAEDMEQEKADMAQKEAEKTNPVTFNFNGEWEGDIFTLIFSGDSAQLISDDDRDKKVWYRVELDRTKDPIEMDLYSTTTKVERLVFSMIVRIDNPQTFTVGFSEDMKVRPASFVSDHSVTCTKKNNLVH